MKRSIFLFLLLSSTFIFAQQTDIIKEPQTDKRVELISIAFRLADSKEYSAEIFKIYTDRIQEHYTPFKDHELIDFIRQIKQENGVGYDAVMKMAVHLDDNLNPLVAFSEEIPEPRWGKKNAYEFVRLLKEFYRDTNSEEFFAKNQNLYKQASQRFLPVYKMLDTNWYRNFYGEEPNEEFIIVNGLGNGGGNYGPSVELPNGKKLVYAIMGAWNTDARGMVVFPAENYFPTLLHEFNHSFVNEPLNNNREIFKKDAEIIYEVVQNEMKNGAYGSWETMINEALVRAAVIKYMRDHSFPKEQVNLEILEQVNSGFVWIEDLVQELQKYDNNRKIYPTLENYIPQLAKAYSSYAENIDQYLTQRKQEKPSLVSISEFKNGSKSVDPALKQISLNFDRPFSAANFIRPGKSMENFPEFTNLRYSEDRKTVILDWKLEKGKAYEFVLMGFTPKEAAGDDYPISFITAE